MTISFSCPDCDKSLRAADDKRGKRIKCPGCSSVITIPDDEEDLDDAPQPSQSSKKGLKAKGNASRGKSSGIPVAVWAGVAVVAIAFIVFFTWTKLPAGRGLEDLKNDRLRLQRLTLSMHLYHDANQQFPIADRPENFGPDGRPFLSWRVHLLPFLDKLELYNQFHLNEPWDSPHNKTLLDKMPDEFRSGNSQGSSTRVLALTGPSALFYQRKVGLRDITDGTSNTAMFCQAGTDKVVPWTKPDDIVFDPASPLAAFGRIGKSFLCGMADGTVLEFDSQIDAKTMAAIASPKGGEVINAASLAIQPANQPTPAAPAKPPVNPIPSPSQMPQPILPSVTPLPTPQPTMTPTSPMLTGGTTLDFKVFKIQLPKAWQVAPPDGIVTLHARPQVSQLFPNIKVAVLKPPPGTTLAKVVNGSKESYLQNGSVEDVKETTLQGRSVHRLMMTQNLPGNTNRQLKYFIPAGERILIFSGQAVPEAFDASIPMFEAIVNSLQVGE